MKPKKKNPTRRSITALATKNAIFKAAIRLFAKEGYDNVKIEDITDYAGVSKGTFYVHFDAKDSVLAEQFKRIDQNYTKVFRKVAKDETAANKLRILIAAMCEYCEKVSGINALQVIYANQINSDLAKRIKILNNKSRVFYDIIGAIVDQGRADGEFRTDIEPERMTEWIARHCRGLLYDWCLYNGGDGFDLREEMRKYSEFLLSSLQPRRESGTGRK